MSAKPAIAGTETILDDSIFDRVEAALARALEVATEAGDLDRIDRIVAELRERRQERLGVRSLDDERRGRRR